MSTLCSVERRANTKSIEQDIAEALDLCDIVSHGVPDKVGQTSGPPNAVT